MSILFQRILLALLVVVVVVIPFGCDRGGSSDSSNSTTSNAAALPPPKPVSAELTPVVPLLPRRATHLTVDQVGNLYLVQEQPADESPRRDPATSQRATTPAVGDVLFVAGEADLPRATQLSSTNILAAMGVKGGAGASGNIRSIAAGADGRIYFYFSGGLRKQSLMCLGAFDPRRNAIQILADTAQLARETRMGSSVALARPTVVGVGRAIWLWLRHSDGSAVFRIDTGSIPADGPVALGRPFPRLTAARALDGAAPELTRADDYDVSPGARAGTMLIADVWGGALWEMNERGETTVLHSLVGLPRALSAPGALSEQLPPPANVAATGVPARSIVFFAGDADLIQPHSAERVDPVEVQAIYPALLILRPDDAPPSSTPSRGSTGDAAIRQSLTTRLIAIPRDQLHGQRGLAVHAMQLEQLIYEPARGTWLGYDSPSGQLVRITITAK